MSNHVHKKEIISLILAISIMISMIIPVSVNAFNEDEFNEDEYNSAILLNDNDIIEFSFESTKDVFCYKFTSPYDYATIFIERIDIDSDYDPNNLSLGIGQFIERTDNRGMYAEPYGHLYNQAIQICSGDKGYVKFFLTDNHPAFPADKTLHHIFRYKYHIVESNKDGWKNAVEISEDTEIKISFKDETDDKWYKIQPDGTERISFLSDRDRGGVYVFRKYNEHEILNGEFEGFPFPINGSYSVYDSGGMSYLHIQPIETDKDIFNKEISFMCEKNKRLEDVANSVDLSVDTITTDPTVEPKPQPASNNVITSFGATVSDWAAPEIEKAFENKLIPEVMIDFDLTEKVNRGEFAAIALQLYDVLTKSETGLPSSCPFNDISGDINEQAIKKAYGIQITAGTSNTTFEPISFITREQLATMLCRVVKKYGFKDWTLETDDEYYLNTTGAKIFDDDGDISDWAKPSVYFMSLYGIIQGVDETHFAPKNTTTQQEASGYASATREQAIILAQRIFTKQDMLKNF